MSSQMNKPPKFAGTLDGTLVNDPAKQQLFVLSKHGSLPVTVYSTGSTTQFGAKYKGAWYEVVVKSDDQAQGNSSLAAADGSASLPPQAGPDEATVKKSNKAGKLFRMHHNTANTATEQDSKTAELQSVPTRRKERVLPPPPSNGDFTAPSYDRNAERAGRRAKLSPASVSPFRPSLEEERAGGTEIIEEAPSSVVSRIDASARSFSHRHLVVDQSTGPEPTRTLEQILKEGGMEDVKRTPFTGGPYTPDLSNGGERLTDGLLKTLPDDMLELIAPNALNLTGDKFIDLPRRLVRLDLSGNDSIKSQSIRLLPVTLTELNLSESLLLTDEACTFFPRGLKLLNLASTVLITDKGVAQLPTGLIELIMTDNRRITGASFAKLPATLQRLDFHNVSDVEDSQLIQLPDKLVELDLSSAKKLTDKAIAGMDSRFEHMEELYLGSAKSITDLALPSFPILLKKLILSSANLSDPRKAATLRSTLTQLDISGSKSLSGEFIKKLPKTLQVLDISGCNLSDADFLLLPSSLELLDARGCTGLASMDWKKQFPKLKCLNLAGNTGLTNKSLETMPDTLIHLNLSSNKTITGACFKSLPPGLKFLNLRKASAIDDSHMDHLPPSLQVLDISSADGLTEVSQAKFPPTLTETRLPTPARKWARNLGVPGVPCK